MKTKRKVLDFHTHWVVKKQKNTRQFDDIGGFVVPGAVNDTKKIRKAGGDIFANVGAE